MRMILKAWRDESKGARDRACNETGAARARVLSGEPFATVASEMSDANPEYGGSLGWVHMNEIAPWMQRAVEGKESGAVTEVVETGFGCAILLIQERRNYTPISYEQAHEVLYKKVFSEKMSAEYDTFVEDLRSRTFIERKGIYADAATLNAGPGASEF